MFGLLFAAASLWFDPPAQRFPVAVSLVGDDGLTQNLDQELKNAIQRDRDLRAVGPDDAGGLTISSESNVDWDKLNGRVVVIYRVFVTGREAANPVPLTGACWENDLRKCARDIVERTKRLMPLQRP